MSDTPRTDAEVLATGFAKGFGFVPAVYARELEREIAELRHDLERAVANHSADLNAVPQGNKADVGASERPVFQPPILPSGGLPNNPAGCLHPWRGTPSKQPPKFTCACGTVVYRSYEDYVDD